MTSTLSAVETWQTCSRDRVSSASWTSRATIGGLGRRRPTGQSRAARDLALVAAGSASGQPGILGVLGDHAVEGPDVLQRPAHQPGVARRSARRRRTPGPGRRSGHQAEFGQFLTGQALAHRAHRDDLGVPVPPTQVRDVGGGLGGVGDRIGVGHGQHGGEPAARGRRGAGGHGLGVLPAGFAQMGVQVDQAG